MARFTPEELELSAPGDCTRCGQDSPDGRNTAGQCNACHNAQYYERKAQAKIELESQKAKGREYWAARGIKVGDTVQTFAPSMLGFGGVTVIGTAKVGIVGAYVSAPKFQAGKLAPAYFHKAQKQPAHPDCN